MSARGHRDGSATEITEGDGRRTTQKNDKQQKNAVVVSVSSVISVANRLGALGGCPGDLSKD